MKNILYLLITALLLFSCSTTQTRFVSFPQKVGYTRGESIVIIPVKNLTELKSAELLEMANKHLNENTTLKAIRYWDADFSLKTKGLSLPKSIVDTTSLKGLKENPVVSFVLFSTLVKVDENSENELNNPNYRVAEAMMNFTLYDIRMQKVSWQCTSRIRISPVKAKGKKQEYRLSMPSGDFAAAKLFKKSIKRLVKTLSLQPVHKIPNNS